MEKSFFNEVENEEFKKEVREDILKCLDDERKTNVKLDKRLYELEMDMFVVLMKDIDPYCRSELVSKSKHGGFYWKRPVVCMRLACPSRSGQNFGGF